MVARRLLDKEAKHAKSNKVILLSQHINFERLLYKLKNSCILMFESKTIKLEILL